jgi:uncharacterized protein involved in tolerance to divalent cations
MGRIFKNAKIQMVISINTVIEKLKGRLCVGSFKEGETVYWLTTSIFDEDEIEYTVKILPKNRAALIGIFHSKTKKYHKYSIDDFTVGLKVIEKELSRERKYKW